MAAIQDCKFKAVTLAAGETFVLPPGAVLIGSTDESNFTADCDIPPLETPECYTFNVVATEESGGTTPVFKADNIKVLGFYLTNTKTFHPFPVPTNSFTAILANIAGQIPQTDLGPIFTDICVNSDDDSGGDRGQAAGVTFKTIPSIGDNLQVRVSTSALLDPDFTYTFNTPVYKYADAPGPKCGDCEPV